MRQVSATGRRKIPQLFARFCGGTLLVFWLCGPPTCAQAPDQAQSSSKPDNPLPSGDGWRVAIVPYIWFAGVNGTVGALGHQASVHATFGDVASYLNLGFMGTLDTRYGRLLLPTDFMWIKLSDDKALPFEKGATSVKAKMTQTILSQYFGYRLVGQEKFKADAIFGMRFWHLTNDLTLQPAELAQGFSASEGWVDGVAGGRFTVWLTPKTRITIFGDAGGGAARYDYQVIGTLGFKISRKWILQAGYRYMDVNYRQASGAFLYDVAQSGLLLGATWSVK